ncbi:hypothetical protein IGJ19_002865 [Enterococcus sp. DIV1368b]|uniref:Uncharacterized protein n=1 Tax=Enterococcus mundtii TaxID=53346 RepID=A0A242KUM6_ENTMU|nr:hypothetical protein A5802_002833 [Enterococcus mundtii]
MMTLVIFSIWLADFLLFKKSITLGMKIVLI